MSANHRPALAPLGRRAFLRIVSGTAAALALPVTGGCTVGAGDVHTVLMTGDHKYAPSDITVSRGALIVWKNNTADVHSVVCQPSQTQLAGFMRLPHGAQPFDSGGVQPGETWQHPFDTPGQYVYFSSQDADEQMIGTITVTG